MTLDINFVPRPCNSAMYVRMSFWHMSQSRNEGGHAAMPAGYCKPASHTSANAIDSFEFDYTYFELFWGYDGNSISPIVHSTHSTCLARQAYAKRGWLQ